MKLIQLESFSSSTGTTLPNKLYHGTSLNKARDILKNGLDPSFTIDRGDDTDTKGFVFLAMNPQGAEDFVPANEQSAILEITLTDELASKLRTDLGEFIRCPVLIAPKYIKLLKIVN